MSDFTKTKIGFAIALLAALFTISPITSSFATIGFSIISFRLEIIHLYYFIALFLTLAVYFYAVQFLTERSFSIVQKAGDISYAVAIVAPALFVTLLLISYAANQLSGLLKSDQFPRILEVVLGVASGLFGGRIISRLANMFANREKRSTVDNYEEQEISYLERAVRLFENKDYDLCVVECFKALESATSKALYDKGIKVKSRGPRDLFKAAMNAEIVPSRFQSLLDYIMNLRNKASHTLEPISRDQAEEAMRQTKQILVMMIRTMDNEIL